MMLPLEQDKDATYRICKQDDGLYKVVYYLATVPVTEVKGFYAWEAMPEWVKNCMAVLDAAGPGSQVKGFGYRSATTYWSSNSVDWM